MQEKIVRQALDLLVERRGTANDGQSSLRLEGERSRVAGPIWSRRSCRSGASAGSRRRAAPAESQSQNRSCATRRRLDAPGRAVLDPRDLSGFRRRGGLCAGPHRVRAEPDPSRPDRRHQPGAADGRRERVDGHRHSAARGRSSIAAGRCASSGSSSRRSLRARWASWSARSCSAGLPERPIRSFVFFSARASWPAPLSLWRAAQAAAVACRRPRSMPSPAASPDFWRACSPRRGRLWSTCSIGSRSPWPGSSSRSW